MRKPDRRIMGLRETRLLFLVFFAFFYWCFHFLFGKTSLQLSQVVFDLAAGIFTGAVAHVAIAKFFGPLLFGRAFCSWVCWNAALFEFLPVKNNNKTVSEKSLNYKYISLIIVFLIPLVLIAKGYTFQSHKDQFIWLLAENGTIYVLGITLTFILKDRRAFCKYVCPAGALMTVTSTKSIIKVEKNHLTCSRCHLCDDVCPMNVPVMKYVTSNQRVSDPECILCLECVKKCPKKCLTVGIGTKSEVTPEFGQSY